MQPQTETQVRPSIPRGAAGQTRLFEITGVSVPYYRNEEIYGEGEPVEYLYKVLSGTVRAYKLLSDGRRQINGFYLVGDVFGFELNPEHCSSAEALTDCTILMVKRSAVLKSAERDREVAWGLLNLATVELKRSRNHGLLLIKSAQERIAAFLLEMADRMAAEGAVDLPMSRQDIADYLGLTIETVSRTLTQLVQSSTIELLASRQIVLRDHSALYELNN
jgi:CRP-like cAMP-binding protein